MSLDFTDNNGANFYADPTVITFTNSSGYTSSLYPNPTQTANTAFVVPPNNGTTDNILTWEPSGMTSWRSLDSITVGNNFINAAANIGTLGYGPFDNITGNTINFRNINVVGNELVISFDNPNNNIEIEANVGTTTGTLASGVDKRFSANNVLIVQKDPGAGQFLTILSAINFINALPLIDQPTNTNRFIIYVQAGDYAETANLNVPSFVFIVGQSMEAVRISPAGTGYDLFTLNHRTGLAFMSLHDVDTGFHAMFFDDVGDYALVHKIEIENAPTAILCSNSTQDCNVYLEYVGGTDTSTYMIKITDNGSNIIEVSCENFFAFNHADDVILVDGAFSHASIQSGIFQYGDGTGNGLRVINGGEANMRAIYMEGWGVGISAPVDAGAPDLQFAAVLFDNCVINLDIPNLNATGFFNGYTQYEKTSIAKDNQFFITNKNQNVITVGLKGADFFTVGAALAAITDESATNRYVIYVGPGEFNETPFTIRSYISVVGFSRTDSVLLCTTPGVEFISLEELSAISTITLGGINSAGSVGIHYDGGPTVGSNAKIDNITFMDFEKLIALGTNNGTNSVVMINIGILPSSSFAYGFYVEDTNPIAGKSMKCIVNTVIWTAGNTNMNTMFFIKSNSTNPQPNISFFITDTFIGNTAFPVFGTAVQAEGSVALTISQAIFTGFLSGVYLPSTAQPQLLRIGSTFFNLCTSDINVASATATGSIFVYGTLSKVSVASPFVGVTVNGNDGSTAIGGILYQGNSYSEITNISTQIQQGGSIGTFVDGVISIVSGLQVSVDGGVGYLMVGIYPNDYLKYLEWSTQNITLPASTLSWLYIDSAGVLQYSASEPSIITTITIGTVKTNATDVEFIQQVGKHANHTGTLVDQTIRNIGPIFGNGCLASPGTSGMLVSVTSGSYAFSIDNVTPSAGTDISMLAYYTGSPDSTTITNVPTDWDNAGAITALSPGEWTKHTLFVVGDALVQKYLLVYGQETFASLLLATSGPQPIPPSFIGQNAAPISGIIVSEGDTTLTTDRFTDIRPQLGFVSNGSTVTSDHNSLSNLTVGNAHPQYFRVDGTSTMAGDVNMGTNDIINAGTYNSVTVETHGSRHLPAGADPITTAAAVTLNATTVNGIGSANSLARSDHTHTISTSILSDIQTVAAANSNGVTNKFALADHAHQGIHSISNGTPRFGDITFSASTGISINNVANNFEFSVTTLSMLLVTNAGGLNADYTAGSVLIDGVVYPIVADTLILPINTTGLIYVDYSTQSVTSASGTVFPTGCIPMATFTTNATIILTLVDSRTFINQNFDLPIAAIYGGTGQTTYNVGDLIYADTTTTLAKLPDIATGNVLLTGGVSTIPTYGKVGLTTHVSGILPIANGGTNSSTALNNNRIMLSSGGSIIESSALTNGQLLIGSTGLAPVPTTITGTANQVIVTNGAGSITLSLPQAIALISSPTFASLNLTNTINQILFGTGTTIQLSAPTPASSITYTLPDVLTNSSFVMSDGNQTINGIKSFTTPIAATSGGTGLSSYVIGDLVYANSTTTLTRLPDIATGNVLLTGGIGVIPSYGKVGLTTHVSGILPAANGGTGLATYTIGDLIYADSTTSFNKLADIAIGNVLLTGGLGAIPTYGKVGLTTHVSGILPIANGGTNSSTALNNNRIMVSSGGSIVESGALTNGQLLIGSTGLGPVIATLTGTANQVIITNGAGSITLSLPQAIALVSSPTFASMNLTNVTNQLVLGTTNTTTINSIAPTTSRTYTIQDAGANGNFAIIPSPYVIGDLIFANSTTTLSRLADIATGNVLLTGGLGTAPSYGKVGLTTHISGILPIANGGTNSSTALNNNRIMISSGGSIIESGALTNGQLLIGSTGSSPAAASIAGTASQVIVTNGANSITLSLPQNIATSSSPTFASETLSAVTNQLILGTTNTSTISAVAPAAPRIYSIVDPGGDGSFAFLNPVNPQLWTGSTQNFSSATILSNNSFISGGNATLYSTGTVSQAGNVITGAGTTFTSAMVGGVLAYAVGAAVIITAFVSATQLTASVFQAVASTTFVLRYGANQMDKFGYCNFIGMRLQSGAVSSPLFTDSNSFLTTTGSVPIASGGTNSTTALANNRVMVSSGGAIVELAAGSDGQYVSMSGGVPAWVTPSSTSIINTYLLNSNGNVSNTVVNYVQSHGSTTSLGNAQYLTTQSGVLRNMYVKFVNTAGTGIPPGVGNSWTIQVLVNGAVTGPTLTISGNVSFSGSDLVNTAAVVAGDTVAVRVTPTSVPTAAVAIVSLEQTSV